MNQRLTEMLADGLAATLKAHVTARLAPLEDNVRGLLQRLDRYGERIAELEKRLAEAEAKAAPGGLRRVV